MADSVLYRSVEKVFANTEARVVAAYKVIQYRTSALAVDLSNE